MGFDFIMDIPMKNMNTNHVNKEDDNSKLLHSAIILVGSTGTGKSSTINKCTGSSAKVGDGCQSVTTRCEVYRYIHNELKSGENPF